MHNRKGQLKTNQFRFAGPLVSLKPSWNHPVLEVLIYGAVTTLTVVGALLCLTSGYGLPVSGALVIAATILCSLLLTCLYRSPVGGWILPVGLLLFGVVLYVGREEFRMEFVLFWNQALKRLFPHLAAPLVLHADSPEYPAGIPLILTVIFLYCLLVGFFSARAPRLFPVFLLTFPLIELVFLVGLSPNLAALISAISGYGMVLAISLTAGSGRFARTGFRPAREDKKENRPMRLRPLPRVFAPAMATVLVLLLCAMTVTQNYLNISHYERPKVLDDIRQTALDMNWRSILYNPDLFRGRLNDASGQRFDHKTDIKVTLPWRTKTLYLKGYTAARYANGRWTQLEDDIYNSEPFVSMEADGTSFAQESFLFSELYRAFYSYETSPAERITVEPIRTGKRYAYLPYFSHSTADLGYDYDRSARLNSGSTYSSEAYKISHVQNQFVFNLETLSDRDLLYQSEFIVDSFGDIYIEGYSYITPTSSPYEGEYQAFVRKNYTALPEGLEKLEDDVQSQFIDTWIERYGSKDNVAIALNDLVTMVQNYLKSHAEYSLSPGTTPPGTDPVLYFLYENRKGYCMHFASAATLIFRSMGIPARYVEGYVITDADVKKGKKLDKDRRDNESEYALEIPDSNAHAWTEIYLDGFGWCPAEATPGYRGEISELPTVSQEKREREQTISDAAATSSGISSAATSSEEAASSSAASTPAKSEAKSRPLQVILLILLLVVALLSTLLLHRRVMLSLFRRRTSTDDVNANVLTIYGFMVRLLSAETFPNAEYACYHPEKLAKAFTFLSAAQWEASMETILCARFSGRSVTKAEQEKLLSAYHQMRINVYRQKKWPGRLRMKYIRALI